MTNETTQYVMTLYYVVERPTSPTVRYVAGPFASFNEAWHHTQTNGPFHALQDIVSTTVYVNK